MPHCNTINFQHFLDEFLKERPEEYKIIVLDNGTFFKTKTLKIPKNIGLIFLPLYSPKLNQAEKIWTNLKRKFTNKFCKNLAEASLFITESINSLDKELIQKTCHYEDV